jgi:hypothetical protein
VTKKNLKWKIWKFGKLAMIHLLTSWRSLLSLPEELRTELSVIYSYNKSQRDALISQTYFWNRTLHVSDRFSVHHQESSTVHTAVGMCHTGCADCLIGGSRIFLVSRH